MKKYLGIINTIGSGLFIVGIIIKLYGDKQIGTWLYAIGIILLLVSIIYKVFHLKEYKEDFKENVITYVISVVGFVLIMISILYFI